TGEMPVLVKSSKNEFPHEEAEGKTFEEIKRDREAKETKRLEKEKKETIERKHDSEEDAEEIVEDVRKELGVDEDEHEKKNDDLDNH
ncbi:MAG: cell division protein FtsH, partial [Carnobacterium sp.]